MAAILQGGVRDTNQQIDNTPTLTTKFAVTDFTEDYALACNAEAGATALADVVATLIRELIRKGILDGTVSA